MTSFRGVFVRLTCCFIGILDKLRAETWLRETSPCYVIQIDLNTIFYHPMFNFLGRKMCETKGI